MIEINFDISSTRNYKFKKTRSEEIVQNIENILSRVKGNVPLNRGKGIDSELIDENTDYIKTVLASIVMDEIERDETRFKVDSISYDTSSESDGKMIVIVRGEIIDE
ncbi:MAG: hypothetical protein ACRCZO_20585 [Cetobacterium sp.]|uniref:hypothetical protein n=1 Tax=Cetobacterium sp. ZOR0034 TaxID=1339239 RepID=UPI00068A76FA|nr:hypothetical protein [Cetobacterium sp. ZOR0034]